MKLIKIFSREYSVQYTEMSLRSLGVEVKKHIPKIMKTQIYIPDKGNESVCFEQKEWNDFIDILKNKYKPFSNTLENFIKDFHKFGRRYVRTSQKISLINLSKLNNDTIANLYNSYIKIANIYTSYLWLGLLLGEVISDKGMKILSKRKIETNKIILNSLLSPSGRSGILEFQDKLINLKKKGVIILSEKQILEMLKEYSWMPCLDIHNDPWTKKEIIGLYKNIKPKEKEVTFRKATQLARLNSSEKRLFEIIRELIYIKDMRDVYRRKGVYYALPLFEEIAKRFNIPRKDLAYYTNQEIIYRLESKESVHQEKIRRRKKGFLISWKNKKIFVTTNKKEIKIVSKKIITQQKEGEIKGVVASKGKVEGITKIVLSINDLGKIKKGDILVAITTHPDFILAMQKAVAFITDEGGVTSHAAIVAREMNKPCIVGTKIATKILKDGDLVEVDAEKGIVKILKKR